MDKSLLQYSADNNLDFYYDVENIPNSDLVVTTLEYFEKGKRKDFFEPLQFINLLWKQYSFVIDNIKKSHTTITSLKSLPLTLEQQHVLLGFILKWFGGYPIMNNNQQYNNTLRLIEREFLAYEGETPEKEFCQKNWKEYMRNNQMEDLVKNGLNREEYDTVYDFEAVQKYLSSVPDVGAKIQFLIEIKTDYKQKNDPFWTDPFSVPFDKQCELEIRKLEKISQIGKASMVATQQSPIKVEYTNSQLVLIFYFFLKHSGFEARVNMDIAPIAKFLHLITGKEFTTTQNSDFYKKLTKAPNHSSDKSLIEDLRIIKPLFQKVQLSEIERMIDNEIEQCLTAIKGSKTTKVKK